MPSANESGQKTLQQVVELVGVYPIDAYEFVHRGLAHTVNQLHASASGEEPASRHVCGQQLCEGLRDYALSQWGLMARTVLRRWNITSTLDFGKIVFAMVDNGLMQKTEQDSLEDFRGVYDFAIAFEAGYHIESGA
jgi:uncharacterized repeat protein (TIGR04138 family)